MVVLSRDMIVNRVKSNDIDKVKELNMCGRYLTDVSIIQDMPALELLVLSVNDLATLKSFATCLNLRTLLLRKNQISDLSQLYYLKALKNLKHLSMVDNPIVRNTGANYRTLVLRELPNLESLDDVVVNQEEREFACSMNDTAAAAAATTTPKHLKMPIEYCDHKNYKTPQPTDSLNVSEPQSSTYIDEIKHKVSSKDLNSVSATLFLLRDMDIDALNAVDNIIKDLVKKRLNSQSKGTAWK